MPHSSIVGGTGGTGGIDATDTQTYPCVLHFLSLIDKTKSKAGSHPAPRLDAFTDISCIRRVMLLGTSLLHWELNFHSNPTDDMHCLRQARPIFTQ
jgi:hypothetical protein